MRKKPVFPPLTKPDPSLKEASLLSKSIYFVTTTFWTGHLPASGTWGSTVTWLIHSTFFPNLFTWQNWPYALTVVGVLSLTGILCAEYVERMTGVKDDSRVTIDEVVGYCITVLFLPPGWYYTAPALLVCRFFDILKPPPARQLQEVHGGIGIMIDDMIAGVYGCLFMHGVLYLFHF